VFRHFPLNYHDKAFITSEAAEAAGAQGAFWEMHDLLYERYQDWAQLPVEEMPELLGDYAQELDLDAAQFADDLENNAYEEEVNEDYESAIATGMPATPSFIVNGVLYPAQSWGLSYQGLEAFVRLSLLAEQQFDSPPPQVIDVDNAYMATIQTSKGDMVIELYDDAAPTNVNSFVFLAESGWYDGVTFFRVVPDFVAQTGDPTSTGAGHPGYQCDDEITERGFDQAGVVGIATAGPNTGSSQFFITFSPQPDLNGRYTVIGQVVEGLDVLESLTPRDPTNPDAPPGDLIETIVVEEQ